MLDFITLGWGNRNRIVEVRWKGRTLGFIADSGFRVDANDAVNHLITLSPDDLREIAKKTEEVVKEAELRKDPILNQRFVTGLAFLIGIFLMQGRLIAQHVTDLQTRPIGHVQYDFYKNSPKGFFAAGWVIGNGRYYGTNNVNLLAGIGYRQETAFENWWFESMIQRQWSESANGRRQALLWDNRFQYSIDDIVSLYIEAAPFLDHKNRGAVYDMVVFERMLWRRLNLRLETENVHKSGMDSLGVGPGVGWSCGSLGPVKVNGALVYQFRRQESDALRFYLVFNRRVKR